MFVFFVDTPFTLLRFLLFFYFGLMLEDMESSYLCMLHAT